MARPILSPRPLQPTIASELEQAGLHPLLAQLYAARHVKSIHETHSRWGALLAPHSLHHIEQGAQLLADAIEEQWRILIVADYDCDGATACTIGMRALTEMGADVDFLVPNRFETGYGLSAEVVRIAHQHPNGKPDLIVTVDNGIASVEGVALANELGIQVLVTDHHLPGDQLPDAAAIINPSHPDCGFPSKHLAGVGVIFYLMLALRAELRERGAFDLEDQPRLDQLADILALGTVADVVQLDANNRLLVAQGLKQIRSGRAHAGINALFAIAGRDTNNANAFDLGFAVGPRINAAGRLTDMSIGIRCLCTDDPFEAAELAKELDRINQERRQIESGMHQSALNSVEQMMQLSPSASVCVYGPDWHQGVVGLVASRLKEKYWRPTIAFAPGDNGEIKGSGRSIPDVHMRDVLDIISKKHPSMILKFGGHSMAAGLSIHESNIDAFKIAFEQAVIQFSGKTHFEPIIEHDGSLAISHIDIETATLLNQQVWGAGFPPPVFVDQFTVLHQRILKDKHLKLRVERDGLVFDAIWFNHAELVSDSIEMAYRLDVNHWNGNSSVQFMVDYAFATELRDEYTIPPTISANATP